MKRSERSPAGNIAPGGRRADAPRFFARSRAVWRAWLSRHHDSEREIWLVYYKKHTAKRSVVYPEALDEALCFGWIDGILKRIDDERYMQRWTPRRNVKGWSAVNLGHVRRLIAEKRMTPAGLRVLGVPLDGTAPAEAAARATTAAGSGKEPRAKAQRRKGEAPVPEFIRKAIARDEAAAAFFAALAPSHRRRYVTWILDAKREETRARRLAETLRLLAEGQKELLK